MLKSSLKHLLSAQTIFCISKKCLSSACKTNTVNIQQLKISELSNGLKVASEETNLPIACISVFAWAGSRFEADCYNGISHFIEHMAYKGFYSMNKQALESTLEDIGAKMSAHTTREYQYFTAICTPEHVSQVVTILSKILLDLEYPFYDVNIEKEKIQLEAIDNDNNPKAVVFDYLHQTAFQGTTLGQPVIGPIRNLERFNAHTASCFMRQNYHPTRLVLASSGGVSHSDIEKVADNIFRTKMTSDCSQLCGGPQRFTGSQIMYRDDSMPFAHVAIAVEVPGFNSTEYFPLLVASNITGSWDRCQGGDFRHASPLARAASVSKLCVRFESFYIAYRDVGLWGVYYVSEADDVDEMMLTIQDRWMKLCTSTTYTDVQRAAMLTKLQLAKNVDGTINSCLNIGKQVLYTSTLKPVSSIYDDISRISVSTIKTVCNDYIYDKCPAVASVGPTEVLAEYTRIRAGMYWLRR